MAYWEGELAERAAAALERLAGNGNNFLSVLVVHVDKETNALDKTWQEIADSGFAVLVDDGDSEEGVKKTFAFLSEISDRSSYSVKFNLNGSIKSFVSAESDGFPEESVESDTESESDAVDVGVVDSMVLKS